MSTQPESLPRNAASAAPIPSVSAVNRGATSLPQTFQLAAAAYRTGDLATAGHLCRLILETQADHFDALNVLGLVAARAGRPDEATTWFEQAVGANPDSANACNNLGKVLNDLRRFDEALDILNRAVAIDPRHASAHNNRGIALQGLLRFDDALASHDRALSIKADYAEAHLNRGNVLRAMERLPDALASYEQALAIRPAYARAHANRGLVLGELHRYDEALGSCDRALQIDPGDADAHNIRGNALKNFKRFDEALQSYDRALAIRPEFAAAHYNKGAACDDLRRFEDAVASYDAALKIAPADGKALNNRGNSLTELGRVGEALDSYDRALRVSDADPIVFTNRGNALMVLGRCDDAIASFEQALKIDPDYGYGHWNLSLCRLLAGDFLRGWKEYEWGWKIEQRGKARSWPGRPLWLGQESLQEKTILLHCEQGLGDTIQFCRYARLVADAGARVILEVQKPLVALLHDLDGVAQIVAMDDSLPEFDYHCPLMSLPMAFGTEISTIPAATAYLKPDPAKLQFWKDRLGDTGKLKVGLVWAGGFRPDQPHCWGVNERRNIDLAKLASLKDERIEFHSLQKGQPAESDPARLAAAHWVGPPIIDHTGDLADFTDTAALIDNLDLVISVDTSAAHLAAALGKPTWILNRFDTCWRWLLDREDSPWYPTVRLYRQSRMGDWSDPVERIRADLRQLCDLRQDGPDR